MKTTSAVKRDADGTVIRTGARARNRLADIDLTRLMVGSEGRGLHHEITLKPQHPERYSGPLSFPSYSACEKRTKCDPNVPRADRALDAMVGAR